MNQMRNFPLPSGPQERRYRQQKMMIEYESDGQLSYSFWPSRGKIQTTGRTFSRFPGSREKRECWWECCGACDNACLPMLVCLEYNGDTLLSPRISSMLHDNSRIFKKRKNIYAFESLWCIIQLSLKSTKVSLVLRLKYIFTDRFLLHYNMVV